MDMALRAALKLQLRRSLLGATILHFVLPAQLPGRLDEALKHALGRLANEKSRFTEEEVRVRVDIAREVVAEMKLEAAGK